MPMSTLGQQPRRAADLVSNESASVRNLGQLSDTRRRRLVVRCQDLTRSSMGAEDNECDDDDHRPSHRSQQRGQVNRLNIHVRPQGIFGRFEILFYATPGSVAPAPATT